MAEAAILYSAKKIGDALLTEGISQAKALFQTLQTIRGQMRKIKRRLELMQAYLEYVNSHSIENKRVSAWVKQVRELAFDIEDLVDEYTYIMTPPIKGNGFAARVYHGFTKTKKVMTLKAIADELLNCNDTLRELWEDKNRFGIKDDDASMSGSLETALSGSKELAESAHTIRDDSVFGVDDHKAKLMKWLKDEQKSETTLICVWGMGGVGKTTLVTSVYRSPSIDSYFECRVWVSVSQTYNRDDLLKKLIREIHRETNSTPPSNLDSCDYRELVAMLNIHLGGKRYFIILDDVWVATVWKDLTDVICGNNMKSRVIITTRSQEVARAADKSLILELKPLDETNARNLFYHHAFIKQRNRECPQSLKEWADKIVPKCGGLPLALVWIANYLATQEQSENSWQSVYSMLVSSGEKNEVIELKMIGKILGLSIANLPYNLQICFVYCSIFPEDYEIKRKKLLRLWVSEGFVVKERMERTKMEIAEDYLNQLVGRSMFQVVARNRNGRVKALKVHDLVRDMIVQKQQSENFYETWHKNIQIQDEENVRCLSITEMDDKENSYKQTYYTPKLRSLHSFSKSISSLPLRKYKLLRVLNLDNSAITSLPEEVCSLFNLRYLSIVDTEVRRLPKGICKLRNLESLDIRRTNLEKMPKGMTKLEKLQHLQGYDIKVGDLKGIENLKHLQTLKSVCIIERSKASSKLLQQLGSLTKLRTLYIKIYTIKQSLTLSASITNMTHLTNLWISTRGSGYITGIGRTYNNDQSIDLDGGGLTELPRQLYKLYLSAPLQNDVLPKCLHTSTNYNLISLRLDDSKLGKDPIPIIAASSPNLRYLKLHRCLKGEVDKLCFPVGSFPNLTSLKMVGLYNVNMVEIQESSLVCLESMNINGNLGMQNLPSGIQNLSKLNYLYLRDTKLIKILQDNEEERSKIQHIPFVTPFVSEVFRNEEL